MRACGATKHDDGEAARGEALAGAATGPAHLSGQAVRTRRQGSSRVALASLLVAGCGYTSQYEPARDGRARAVWRESDVGVDLAGAPLTAECASALKSASSTGRLRLVVASPPGERSYWRPRYYGSPIVVVQPGLAPPLLHPPLFVPVAPIGVAHGLPGVGASGGGSLSGDTGKLLAYVAVILIIVLPLVDVWLALDDPETEISPQAIDQVNRWNDLARTPGSPCADDAPPVGGSS